jgi:DNA-binding SARP family transcriptional activator
MAEIRVLGPVLVMDGDVAVHVGGPRQLRLLASLLVDAGTPVPVDVLVERVFGSDPPRRAEASLRTYITRLRHALPVGVEVVAESAGYAVRLAEGNATASTCTSSSPTTARGGSATSTPTT